MKKHLFTLILCLMATVGNAQDWPPSSIQTHAGSRWWWLGSAVTEDGIRQSMREYASHGIRTLEITPIYGVQGNESQNIDFLSPQWMQMLQLVEQEGLRDSVQIDMNCGTGWPFGGPTVPLDEATCRVAFRADTLQGGRQWLIDTTPDDRLQVCSTTEEDGEGAMKTARLQVVMAYPLQGGSPVELTDLVKEDGALRWKAPRGQWQVILLYYVRTLQQVNRAAPGGEGLVIDHFDAEAVRHYLQRFDEAFAQSGVPYPDTFFNDSYEVYGADWTPRLFDEFESRRGYRLQDHLPELIFGVGTDATRVLVDYRETLGDLLLENFTNQWTAWAHSHGVRTRNQAHGSPANLIDHYAAVDIPEIEGFGLSDFGIKGLRKDPGKTRPNYSDLSMMKYASSAAHITGKPLTSCESFTWLTEHFRTSLSQLKPDMDLIFCAGVNRMLFHGTVYSPQDDPWPGWKFYASIDMSPTNSIWRDAPWFMQYVERCQRFLQWGEADNDFLVYLPVRDMWARRNGQLLMMFEISNMKQNAPEFIRDVLTIDSLGYDCDYISDRYLLTTTCSEGKLTTAAGTSYRALIIPGEVTLTPELKRHLDTLQAQGAHIIYDIDEAEMNRLARPEVMKTRHGLNLVRRQNERGYHYFIANLTPDDVDAWVPLGVDFSTAMLFNPMNGERYGAQTRGAEVRLSLRSGESVILQTLNEVVEVPSGRQQLDYTRTKDLTGQQWILQFVESAPIVDRSFMLDGLRTWESLDDDSVRVTMGTGAYTTHFRLTADEAVQPWAIDLGDVRESARVYVNGQLIGCAWAVPFVLSCGDTLREGDNELRIEVTNLPANRIAEMDRRHVPWRKFNNINVVDINYQHTTYDQWEPVESGLNGKVKLVRLVD